MLRSHKLKEEEVDASVRAVARCGAGTNNIPVARMTELGIPVFNTPGANANAVKELVLCGMLLGSRRIVDGVNHMKKLGEEGLARERVEKDKAMFGGRELKGKTLAVIGLGHIGSITARDAGALGMDLVGYDPGLSVNSALKLPRDMMLADSISSAVANADYIRYVPLVEMTTCQEVHVIMTCFSSSLLPKSQHPLPQGNTRRGGNSWNHWQRHYPSFQA